MIDINDKTLAALYVALKQTFQNAFTGVKPLYPALTTLVPSTSAAEIYGWAADFPAIREWIGDREIHKLAEYEYAIKNRKFESTITIPADKIADNQLAMFSNITAEMGQRAARHPDQLLFELLRNGTSAKGYDGVPFFGEHSVSGLAGKSGKVSNASLAASKPDAKSPWYLLDLSRALRPFIWQEREKYTLTALTDPRQSRDVFMRDEYLYGIRGRGSMGYGFWQMAFMSNLELTADNFTALRGRMVSQRDHAGDLLGIKPSVLLVGESNREAAFYIAQAQTLAGQAPNPNYNLVDVWVTPFID
ncbi:Mu-like prophage major head subunit gpT family protein [Cedecea sp. NFIX57]|uniref:Mu-like prophage major head subunit gpT family protein n=1 Tax=Cedecea sp. NFIX57 TaxID=1566286 RepID=UPI000A0C6DC9|nr:Mu-like prophage major head subunit gpT family protein [Cedecea sp. NFIX57]SMG61810.1 Mu-like prophage major head subunit gpT [Cedecea sp. NFIX57]